LPGPLACHTCYDKKKDSQRGSYDQRRKRLDSEIEKLRKTEEELLAYRPSMKDF
jgi:hypothetical protein